MGERPDCFSVPADLDFPISAFRILNIADIGQPFLIRKEVKVNHSLQAILVVSALTCAMMAEALWSSLYNNKSLRHSLHKSIATGSGFIIYAGIDYLMIAPGSHYPIAAAPLF